MGNLTQVLFYYAPISFGGEQQDGRRNDNDQQDKISYNYEKHIAKLVLLSTTGTVLKDHQFRLAGGMTSNITQEKLIMNYAGEIIQVQTVS